MKQVFALLFLVCAASAQVTVNIGSVTVPNEVSNAIETWRLSQFSDPQTPITLVGSINASATAITLSTASHGITASDQLVIDNEALNVSAVNGANLTVTRGASITTGAAHNAGAVVHIARFRSAVALMKAMIRAEVNAILTQQPSATLQTEIAKKTAADTAIASFLAASVQE